MDCDAEKVQEELYQATLDLNVGKVRSLIDDGE